MYDYLIVGSGLYGSVLANQLKNNGKKCLVIEKRNHIGGNCYTENCDGIDVHKYGPHIFHTSNERVWKFINCFSDFNNFVSRVKVIHQGNLYSFPINLFTLYQIFGVKTPAEAKQLIDKEIAKIQNPTNFEESCLSTMGETLYHTFFYGYTKKQWNREPSELPAAIFKRLPFRLDFNDNYYNDTYQGIPKGGYTKIFEKLIDGIEVRLNTDFTENQKLFLSLAKKIVYTGPIDSYFNFEEGRLEYRSLRFEEQKLDIEDYQGNAIVNYTEEQIPHTRICEHKHFTNTKTKNTIITKEYPQDYDGNNEPYYPINDYKNHLLYKKYENKAKALKDVIFGGRLGEYRYYDMDKIIELALNKAEELLRND